MKKMFTLVELMIMVTAIGILAAMFMSIHQHNCILTLIAEKIVNGEALNDHDKAIYRGDSEIKIDDLVVKMLRPIAEKIIRQEELSPVEKVKFQLHGDIVTGIVVAINAKAAKK